MQEIAKVDQRTQVEQTTVDLVLHRLFNADNVPPALIESVRQYQQQLLNKGITQSINFNQAVVNECRIDIGNMTLAIQSSLAKNELANRISQLSSMDTSHAVNSGQLNWQFAGSNQFNHITIRIEERTWEVEFSRLQRPIHSQYQLYKASLKTQAHQEIYQKLCDALKPIEQSTLAETILLQGSSGLGKTHCSQHYFYHQARQQHQMVAWLSGHTEEAFLQDWKALAQQLRNIDTSQSEQNDEMVILNWCENQLGQWLFIIDDVNVDAGWLREKLPRHGGHILMTTSRLNYLFHPNQITLSFSPLTEDDSKQLLHAYAGEYWQATGYPEEEKAVNYLSKVLGGSPLALTQIALLVRKKSLSFQRVMEQFKQPALRKLLLADTVFEQLKEKTFLATVQKNWNQLIMYLAERYPQLNPLQHEQHLVEFITLLQQETKLSSDENIANIQIFNATVQTYWKEVWANSTVVYSEAEIQTCLSYLSLSYDTETDQWQLSLAGLSALALQSLTVSKLNNLLKLCQIPSTYQQVTSNNINRLDQFASDAPETNLQSTQPSHLTVTDGSVIKDLSQFSSYAFEFGQNVRRDTLREEEKVKQKIVNRIPKHFQLGAAIGKGDCFFDAMAQSLNRLRGREEYTAKSLRLLCDDYVKSEKHVWVKEAIEAEGDDYNQYLVRIPFTVEELEEEEKGNSGLKLEDIVWGRPEIEGRMICEIINIKLHVIGILEGSIQRTDVVEQLIDAQAPEPIVMIEEGQYDNVDIVHLVNHQNHFVPLFNSKMLQGKKSSMQIIEGSQQDTWEKLSLPSRINFSIDIQDSSLKHAEITISTVGKPREFRVWQLPTSNPYFIPRPTLTQILREKLPQRKVGEASAQLLLTAATGMGGIGKTELARHFITNPDLSCHYQQRFWFTATTESQLRIQFYQLAVYLGLIDAEKYIEDKALIIHIHKWLSIHPGWLMVLDNADYFNTIATWIPKEGGAVLVTTREPTPGVLSPEQIVPVPLLTHEEAVIWLYQLSGRNPAHMTEQEKGAVENLVKGLGYLPLAIAQAAAYLREQSSLAIEGYYTRFITLLAEPSLAKQEDLQNNFDAYSRKVLASTWFLSLCAIDEAAKARHLAPLAQPLLTACAYLTSKNIPIFFLETFLKTFYQVEPSLIEYEIDEYVGQLVRYSLLERNSIDNAVSMHNLVQEVMINSLPLKEKQTYLVNVSQIIKSIFPYQEVAQISDMTKQHDLLPHLEKVLGRVEEWLSNLKKSQDNNEFAELLMLTIEKGLYVPLLVLGADGYNNVGNADQQKVLLERALEIKEQRYGKDHPEVAVTLMNLANAIGALGGARQKMVLLERVLEIQEKHCRKDHLEVAVTLGNLANALGALGEARQQKTLLERVLGILEQHYGKDHPLVALTLVNLANALGALGEARQKKTLLERVLRIQEQHYGKDHPEVAATLNNLANALGALGEARQQRVLLERALGIKEQHYGKDHPEVAATLNNLANALGALGEARQQKVLLERVLEIFEQYYGKDHPEVAAILNNLATALSDLGETHQQKVLLERALEIQEQHYGKDHPEVAVTLNNLATALGVLGEARQEKALLERALEIQEQHYGKNHPEVAVTLMNLANALGALGEARQQKVLLERALEIQEQHYGKDHPKVARTLGNLAAALGALGEAYQQKVLLGRALVIKEQHYGKDHPEVASTLVNLAAALGALGEAYQKKVLLERALEIQELYYGKDHPEVAATLNNLATALGALGEAYQQKVLLERALEIFEQYYGKNHPEVAITLMNLANALGALEDACQQKVLLKRALGIQEQLYGEEHPKVGITLMNLVSAYANIGEWPKAKIAAERAYQILFIHPNTGPQHPHTQMAKKNLDKLNEMFAKYFPEKFSALYTHSKPLATEGNSPNLVKGLRNATNQNDVKKLKELLPQVINVNVKDDGKLGRTALHWAVIKQAYPCIKLLLTAGADATIVDNTRKSSVNYAEENPTPDALFILLSHHYKLPLEDIDAGKLLRRAAHQNRVHDIKLLLKHIKDINEKDTGNSQRTALHWAVIREATDCIEALIIAGADPTIVDASGKTALNYAKGKEQILELLQRNQTISKVQQK